MAQALRAWAINRREKTRAVITVRPSNSVSKRYEFSRTDWFRAMIDDSIDHEMTRFAAQRAFSFDNLPMQNKANSAYNFSCYCNKTNRT